MMLNIFSWVCVPSIFFGDMNGQSLAHFGTGAFNDSGHQFHCVRGGRGRGLPPPPGSPSAPAGVLQSAWF